MANRQANTGAGGLQLGSNPFSYAQQKNNGGSKVQKNVFNTPFPQASNTVIPGQGINTDVYQDQQQHDDDFNFVADPVIYDSGSINMPPDGGPGPQMSAQNFRENQDGYQQYQQQQQNANFGNQQQQKNKLKGVLPNVNKQEQFEQNQQRQPQQQQQHWEADEMVSLDEIEPEVQQQNYQKGRQNQNLAHGNKGQQKFSAPFQQNIDKQAQLQKTPSMQLSEEDEIPLLEDLGIEIDKIKQKFISILTQRGIKENADYDDMAGPLLVCVIFGLLLLLKGKAHFGYIYGFGLSGCFGIFLIINLMSKHNQYVEFYKTMSILGYSLLPFSFLALLAIFCDLNSLIGGVASLLIMLWCTVTATRYFEYGLDMEDKKYLIAYPISLFYFVFMLLTVF